jgi:hypothetical protein
MMGIWARRLAIATGLMAGVMASYAVPAAAATTTTVSFTSPGTQEFTVPAGVTSIAVTVVGAAGGTAAEASCGLADGAAAKARR